MKSIILHDDAFEELRNAASEVEGALKTYDANGEYDHNKFSVGGVFYERYKYVPTPEEIARHEEFRKTPLGQLMEKFIVRGANRFLDDLLKPNYLLDGVDTAGMKVGTALRIRLPRDYFVKIGDEWLDK